MSLASSLRPSRQPSPFSAKTTLRSSRCSARQTPPSNLDAKTTPNFTLYGAPAPRALHRTTKPCKAPSRPTSTPVASPHDGVVASPRPDIERTLTPSVISTPTQVPSIPRLDFSALHASDDDNDGEIQVGFPGNGKTTEIAETNLQSLSEDTTLPEKPVGQSSRSKTFDEPAADQSEEITQSFKNTFEQLKRLMPFGNSTLNQSKQSTPSGESTVDQSEKSTTLTESQLEQSVASTSFGDSTLDQSASRTPSGEYTEDQSAMNTLDASSMSIAAFTDRSSSTFASSCLTSSSWSVRSCSSLPRDASSPKRVATPTPFVRRRLVLEHVESGYYSPDPSEVRLSVAEVLEAADCAHRLAHLLDHALGRELGVGHSDYASRGSARRGSTQSCEQRVDGPLLASTPKCCDDNVDLVRIPVAPLMPRADKHKVHDDTCHCCGPRLLYFSPLDLQMQRARLKKPFVEEVKDVSKGCMDGDLREVLKRVLLRRRDNVSPEEDACYSARSQWSADGL